MRALTLGLLLLASGVGAQDLGETTFDNSGSPEAQEPFLRGVLLLHSFEYDDARDAFNEAQAIDPGFAMAYWGEAMTHNHPVWMRQEREAALAVLAELDANVEEVTPRERDYLRTLGFLFGTEEEASYDKETRDDRYAIAMRALAENHPDDLDARAFYALSLLGTAHEGRDFTTYMKAAAVAEEVFAENPLHPGAAHYLIHAYDDPVHAPLGLRPARVYDQIAPAASHALHMPSHIYLALGLWEDVRDMNERSYAAARGASDLRGEALNGHGWHALWWWHYAATQLEDRPLAERLLALAVETHEGEPTGSSATHTVRIRAQHAMEFDAWDVYADADPLETESLWTFAIDAYARGFAHVASRDVPGARALLDELEERMAQVSNPDDIPWSVRAGALSLSAIIESAEQNPTAAVELFRQAAALEAAAPLTFGPPAPVLPANEMLGMALASAGDPVGAKAALDVALSRAPNRRRSMWGLGLVRELMEEM